MNLLLALLAFAGVMAFLSTSMSIVLEGIHKALAWRRAGLEEVLRTLHDDVLARLGPGGSGAPAPDQKPVKTSADANRFARSMTENVSFGGRGRPWWLRNIPILSWLFQRRQEKLTTLQFVEGFARTDAGRRLADFDPAHLRRALTVAAYEFERYCDSQAAYFKRRAAVLSVLMSVMFAFAVNIDAFYIFERLARNPNVAGLVANTTERSIASDEAAMQNAAAQTETTPRLDDGEPASASAKLDAQKQAGQDLSNAGVPMGYMAFPYCLKDPVFLYTEDPRCHTRTDARLGVGAILQDAGGRIVSPGSGGLLWLVSVIVAGGLIGLGAPFWYDFFRRLARMVPAGQRVTTAVVTPQTNPPPAGGPEVVRDRAAANPHALVLAYRVASGKAAASAASVELDETLNPLADTAPASGAAPVTNPGVAFGGETRIRRPL